MVGVRPQTLKPTDAADGLLVKVDVVEYLGTESQIVGHLQVPEGQRIAAIVPGDAKALLHQGVRLSGGRRRDACVRCRQRAFAAILIV
jgi:hypothetical protein